MSERSLAELEDLLLRVVERLGLFRTENSKLIEEVRKLKQDLEELERENQGQRERIKSLEERRSIIRAQVKKVLNGVATLEDPVRKSSLSAHKS